MRNLRSSSIDNGLNKTCMQHLSVSPLQMNIWKIKYSELQRKIYMLFAGREVRIGKICALGLDSGRAQDRGHSFSQYGPT